MVLHPNRFHLTESGPKQIFGRFNKEQLEKIAAGDFSDVKD